MSTSSQGDGCPSQISEICKRRHWAMYWLIIFVAIGTIGGRVATVKNWRAQNETAFFSANDKSRWCTISALVDEGTYQIDDVSRRPGWQTIDKVQHLSDEDLHFYSSKPTLFPTMVAGQYWVLKKLTGSEFSTSNVLMSRLILFFTNVIPFFVFLFLLASLLERIVVHDWTRYFILCCGAFGTYLTTFSVTLNNHLPAAISVMIALYCLDRIYRTGAVCHDQCDAGWSHYFVAGLFAAFAAANELPALSFLCCAGALCVYKSPVKSLAGFVPAVGIVAAGFFGTNYLAHGTIKPAYLHRGDGEVIANVEMEPMAIGNGPTVPREFLAPAQGWLDENGFSKFSAPRLRQSFWKRNADAELTRFVIEDELHTQRFAVEQTGPNEFEVRAWGNWYDYAGSYWSSGNRSPVDRGQESRILYAFHMLFGHHGIFSLTPIWLFAFAGMVALPFAKKLQLWWLGILGLVLTIVVFGFYVRRPVNDCNYGGVTSALRWMFWLIPIWLVSMVPVVDSIAKKKWGKIFCLSLLALSIASCLYAAQNPWVHPWFYELWSNMGWPNL